MPEGATIPEWIRKAAMAALLAELLADPEVFLTREFGLQRRDQHVRDLAIRLFDIATEKAE